MYSIIQDADAVIAFYILSHSSFVDVVGERSVVRLAHLRGEVEEDPEDEMDREAALDQVGKDAPHQKGQA